MTEADRPAIERIRRATAKYRRAEKALDEARSEARDAVLDALRAGERPTPVADASPFTPAWVRALARENGIEAQPRKKTAG